MDCRIQIVFYGDDELKQRLNRRAKEEDRSLSAVLRRAAEKYLSDPIDAEREDQRRQSAPQGER